jgi:hypothetical protein
VFQPLASLFRDKKRASWQEGDIKYFIQDYLRRTTRSDQLYCQAVNNGRATVQVSSPMLQQEVRLLEYDLRQVLKSEANYRLKELQVIS